MIKLNDAQMQAMVPDGHILVLAGKLKDQWQKVCLWAEMGIFLCMILKER